MIAPKSPARRLWLRLGLLTILLVAAALLARFLLNEVPDRRVVGPSLSELSYSEVSFQNGNLSLAGLLFLPAGSGPFPAAVIIHGSGTSRRSNAWYLTVVERLQEEGFAVLLPDKRGSESSGGDWRDTSFEELATDTEAAIRFVAGDPRVDGARVGIIGLSQGGWIAPVVAADHEDIAFVVSMSGAGVTAEEQLIFEEINNIVDMGTFRVVAQLIAPITTWNIRRQPHWRANAGFDPLPYWERVRAPAFAAFGGGDTNIPVPESVRRLENLKKDILVTVYPDGGHGILNQETQRVQAAYLDDLAGFLRTVEPAIR